ncbi:MAG: DNA-binding protein [Hyphomicrobiales bacterium]|nr:DNA-binding protein [Hyphomicrobiales bacterium]
MPNQLIADRLREAADLLQQQGANRFRSEAYRRAGGAIESTADDIAELFADRGIDGLIALPGIGRSIAAAIAEMVQTGRWVQLERLRGSLSPEQVFQAVPGIGATFSRRIHDRLGVDTLEALEIAAADGRLRKVPGIGARRAAAIRAALASMLMRPRRPPFASGERPGVDVILNVDQEYRSKAASGSLRRIAPRRFNPDRVAWLPVLHTERGDWRFTALFSNTARAHELNRIADWVVIYFHKDDEPEIQSTVVTETSGPLTGKRVVRGRELECFQFYDVPQ